MVPDSPKDNRTENQNIIILPPAKNGFVEEINNNGDGDSSNKRSLLLRIISLAPGIRYRDLLRMTTFNNGTLTHHLSILEKNSIIKVNRAESSNITRYYPVSIPSEETLTYGFLKMKTTRQIILYLYKNKTKTFSEIVEHINKSPSTTSWTLKRLYESKIIIKRKKEGNSIEFYLKNPSIVEKILSKDNNNFLDRSVDSYLSIIDQL